MGRNLIPWVLKTCGHRQADSGRIKPGSETVNNPDPDSFRPQNQRSRTQNPQQTRPQPPVERGWADKADSRPPLRGPGGWGGDWYIWHAPDGLRARAATELGCVQAGAEKLGVIEASYASAIIGVLSPVSSHCFFSPHAAAQPWGGGSIHFLEPRKRGPSCLPGEAEAGASQGLLAPDLLSGKMYTCTAHAFWCHRDGFASRGIPRHRELARA